MTTSRRLTKRGRRGVTAIMTIAAALFFIGFFLIVGTIGADEFADLTRQEGMTAARSALNYILGIACFAGAAGISIALERCGIF